MVTPLFPSLSLNHVESYWFSGDKVIDEDAVLTNLEKEQQTHFAELVQKYAEYLPQAQPNEPYEEDEEEEEEDNDDDDDEDSASNDDDNDEELEVDEMPFNPDSPIINIS
ncbi:anaphase-promoting complex subunit 15 [Tetranychus urticae]|uniref:Uncharacterized protein n=1 Tax=Tetranychus urticae TaxID=32264 RepID=T1KTU3_TETUR|nr:anaphase-promoting complex subunit 15 [Tetranychus urticae]